MNSSPSTDTTSTTFIVTTRTNKPRSGSSTRTLPSRRSSSSSSVCSISTSASDRQIVESILSLSASPQPRPRPIPNSYWATPTLLACEYPWTPLVLDPSRQKLDCVLKAGVRTFIDLTEEGELSPYASHLFARTEELGIDEADVEYHRFPIVDRRIPRSREYMYEVLEVLKDNERRGRICAVHCRGGIGRTGMVIGCWLVQSGLAKSGEDALKAIAVKWRTVEKCTRFPHSPETGPQFEFVKNFQPLRRVS